MSELSHLLVVKITDNAILPTRASGGSAGLDLYSAYNYTVSPRCRQLVKTDLKICLPDGTYGRIAPRSGLSLHCYVDVAAGVVDSDYRGNLSVLVVNNGETDFLIRCGDRIAQLICEKILYPDVIEVSNISLTSRANCGFGGYQKL